MNDDFICHVVRGREIVDIVKSVEMDRPTIDAYVLREAQKEPKVSCQKYKVHLQRRIQNIQDFVVHFSVFFFFLSLN